MKGNNNLRKDVVRKMILNSIPYDEWVIASDLAKKLDLGSSAVARIISRELLNVSVERKIIKNKRVNVYVYRRLNWL